LRSRCQLHHGRRDVADIRVGPHAHVSCRVEGNSRAITDAIIRAITDAIIRAITDAIILAITGDRPGVGH